MTHLMIDLETLHTAPDAVIMQVGALRFDPHVNAPARDYGREWNVDIDSCTALGARISHDTLINFWFKQPDAARLSIATSRYKPISIENALDRLADMTQGCDRVWCHGATFDAPILNWYYSKLGRREPWGYSAVRDTRTLIELAQAFGWERPDTGPTAHTALADCVAQVHEVRSALSWMEGLRPRPVDVQATITITPTVLVESGDTSGKQEEHAGASLASVLDKGL